MTDTNQASEDELEKQIESITQAMFVTLSEWQAGVPIDWHSAKVKGRADLLALIRTEKLKLLDRLSSHQEELFWWTGGEYEKTKAVDMRAIAAERELLTKLEASMSGLLGGIMTPQMEEAINEQQQPAGGITEQIARAQYSAILAKQERKAKERLERSVKKRDRNRKKNKLSRAARRKNR